MRSIPLRLFVALASIPVGLLLIPHVVPLGFPGQEDSLWAKAIWTGVGWAFIAAGLLALSLRAEKRTGSLLMLFGWVSFISISWWSLNPVIFTLAHVLDGSVLPILYFLLMSFPDGRLHSKPQRAIFLLSLLIPISQLVTTMFYITECPQCHEGLNLVFIRDAPGVVAAMDAMAAFALLTANVATAVVLVRRWIGATVPARRVIGPMVLPGLFWLAAFTALQAGQFIFMLPMRGPTPGYFLVMGMIMTTSIYALAATFSIGLLRARGRRARVGELVVELGELPTAEKLRDAVMKALGDPSLEVGVWDEASARYLTPEGDALALPGAAEQRVATLLERHGEPLAAIVHDPALLDDPGLVASVTAAARLAVENERLQAEVLRQLAEVHASRARIVESADSERKRIERNLHDGAQQRLVSLALSLKVAEGKLTAADPETREALGAASQDLEEALTELRELARGTYPAVLSTEGLRPAIESLADRCTVPVDLDIAGLPSERLPENVEVTAYFVIAEGLTNVAKYSGADTARVSVSLRNGDLAVEIADDGSGGADIASGSGLRGLTDRVQAVDGELTIDSAAGKGTRLTARIPCG